MRVKKWPAKSPGEIAYFESLLGEKNQRPEADFDAGRRTFARLYSRVFCMLLPAGLAVAVRGHDPFDAANLIAIALVVVSVRIARKWARSRLPLLAKKFKTYYHGPKAEKRKIQQTPNRVADVALFSLCHIFTSLFAICLLRLEIASAFQDHTHWWAPEQPPLSRSLLFYFLVQLGITFEACFDMACLPLRGHTKDRPMLLHHAAHFMIIFAAYRWGFVRVGAAISALHDVTDIPIDGIRIAQILDINPLLYVSAGSAVITWTYLRAFVFPYHIIASCFLDTEEVIKLHSQTILGERTKYFIWVFFIGPLIVLWCLHCYWLTKLVRKFAEALRPNKDRLE